MPSMVDKLFGPKVPKFRPSKDLRLSEGLRATLSKPFGSVSQINDAVKDIKKGTYLISVGDVTTENLIKLGRVPNLAIFDLSVERRQDIRLAILSKFDKRMRVSNPQGYLTIALWDAIESAIYRKEANAIQVDGEEDLATLACMYLAPLGSAIMYGIPSEGVCTVFESSVAKEIALQLLKEMEAST